MRMRTHLACCWLLQESAPFLRVLGSYPMDLELGVVDSDRPVGFEGSN